MYGENLRGFLLRTAIKIDQNRVLNPAILDVVLARHRAHSCTASIHALMLPVPRRLFVSSERFGGLSSLAESSTDEMDVTSQLFDASSGRADELLI